VKLSPINIARSKLTLVQPNTELAINLKTAKSLDLDVAGSLLPCLVGAWGSA
jgi:hypothetical protein